METTISICYLISMCSTLCILLGTTIYAFISYILTHAEHFSKQIDSIKEKLRQGCKRGFEKGIAPERSIRTICDEPNTPERPNETIYDKPGTIQKKV